MSDQGTAPGTQAPKPQSPPVTDPLVFDIETGPMAEPMLSEWANGELKDYMESAGYQRLKDPAKKEAAVSERRESIIDKAALSAISGRVLAIGYKNMTTGARSADCVSEGADPGTADRVESQLIASFWSKVATGRRMIGFNIKSFDLPFLVQRSWILDVAIPESVFEGRYFSSQFIDLMDVWNCGSREFVSLDSICRVMNCGSKPTDIDGATFAPYFLGGGALRQKAIMYALNDIDITGELAKRIYL